VYPAYRSTEGLSHESPMDQDLWRGKDGGDRASSEGVRVPGGGGVLHLLSSEHGLVVVEIGLVVLRGAVLDRTKS